MDVKNLSHRIDTGNWMLGKKGKGDLQIDNYDYSTSLDKLWMKRKFMEVNKKKNRETYSETFQFIMQSRIDEIPREERFMRILPY
jgi:hypothetical protein